MIEPIEPYAIPVELTHDECLLLFKRAVNKDSWPIKADDPAVEKLRDAISEHEQDWLCGDCMNWQRWDKTECDCPEGEA